MLHFFSVIVFAFVGLASTIFGIALLRSNPSTTKGRVWVIAGLFTLADAALDFYPVSALLPTLLADAWIIAIKRVMDVLALCLLIYAIYQTDHS